MHIRGIVEAGQRTTRGSGLAGNYNFPRNPRVLIGRVFGGNLKMETKRLKRKRRPVGGYSNPLFVKWVEEWRDQAREEGSKVQYAYTKVQALSS